jgi:acetylornithine deacetylase
MAITKSQVGPREMLARLVAFDTTSCNSNIPLVDFVRDYLAGFGIDSLFVHNEDGTKANLYATIGPDDVGGVVLSGHTDVVPVDGQDWSGDPFDLTERDDKLYGRGTCDMKGFIAIALAMVPEFLARPLATPIHLAFSFDEEIGCVGVRPLIEHIVEHLPKPKIVIVGEPTSMRVVNAHKSCCSMVTEVTGLETHSSTPELGVNAINAAGELLGEISRISADMIERGDPSGRFEPPYTSVHVGTIAGGTALNIVPRHCELLWEYRGVPGLDRNEIAARIDAFAQRQIVPDMQRRAPECGIATHEKIFVPGLAPVDGSPAELMALRLARQNDTHTVSYGTEAGLFQEAGMPAIICGPGDIGQAHKPDEYIALDQITQCCLFMERLVNEVRR